MIHAQPTIVVADDNEYLTELLELRFKAERWKTKRFNAGGGLKRYLSREPADLLLLDVEMPHECGFDVLRDLKNDHFISKMPVIMLTGRNAPNDVARAKALGAGGYIVKPFNIERVVGQVRRALRVEKPVLL